MPMISREQLAELQELVTALSADQVTSKRMRGAKLSPRHVLASAAPYRIKGDTPANFIVIPKQLSMWLNDIDGICVTAEEAFAKAAASIMAGQPELFIRDDTVQAWATKHDVLNGADLSSVLDWMAQSGFEQDGVTYNDGPKVSVDWTNENLLNNAISKGPIKIAVAADQLQQSVGNNNGWFGVGFKKDNNTDHCVSLCGAGTISYLASQLGVTVPSKVDGSRPGYGLFSWKTIGIVDVPSMLAITAEAWLRNPTNAGGNGPTPINPTPVPSPTPIPNNIKQQIDTIFAAFERQFSRYPQIVMVLRMVQTYVDSALAQSVISGYQYQVSFGKLPPEVIAIIDGAFVSAEGAYPLYAPLIGMLKALFDQYLGK